MKLKWLINRFTETDSIEVPITFTTTFDATGAEQLRNDLSQIQMWHNVCTFPTWILETLLEQNQ